MNVTPDSYATSGWFGVNGTPDSYVAPGWFRVNGIRGRYVSSGWAGLRLDWRPAIRSRRECGGDVGHVGGWGVGVSRGVVGKIGEQSEVNSIGAGTRTGQRSARGPRG